MRYSNRRNFPTALAVESQRSSPEANLWVAVIRQAISDAISPKLVVSTLKDGTPDDFSVRQAQRRLRREAYEWFIGSNFQDIADLLFPDPDGVRDMILRYIRAERKTEKVFHKYRLGNYRLPYKNEG